MDNQVITQTKIIEMAKNGWDIIIDLYKNSTPEQREKILKILAALGSFATLLNFLRKL